MGIFVGQFSANDPDVFIGAKRLSGNQTIQIGPVEAAQIIDIFSPVMVLNLHSDWALRFE